MGPPAPCGGGSAECCSSATFRWLWVCGRAEGLPRCPEWKPLGGSSQRLLG